MAAESGAGPQEMMEGESPPGLLPRLRGSGRCGRLLQHRLCAVRLPAARRGGLRALRGRAAPACPARWPAAGGWALAGPGCVTSGRDARGLRAHREKEWGCGDGRKDNEKETFWMTLVFLSPLVRREERLRGASQELLLVQAQGGHRSWG